MKTKHSKRIRPYCIVDGEDFKLGRFDPADTGGIDSKEEARKLLEEGVKRLADYQEKLYAQDRWALLIVLQAMDAAGKDGAIKHVMSGVNPQGCVVSSFKTPSTLELNHDFLWRSTAALPQRGQIGIFNRSYYEEVLVVRVHEKLLEAEKLPKPLVGRKIWKERFEDINAYERHLHRNGTIVRKFFLHVSRDEQKRRFLSRLEENDKNWKFSPSDAKEREFWPDYQRAYEKAIRHTSSGHAPWYVVPADNKWFAHFVVASVIVETLASLGLEFPKVDAATRDALATARTALLAEK